jgi:hypothetical protein
MTMRVLEFLSVTVVLTASAPIAFAQGSDAATAQALFEEGRALLQAGKTAQACPKLAESHRLDPGTGALLALALCHEREGKLASAWAEFNEVQGRANRENRPDRSRLAQEHAGALRTRLSTLLIQVPPSVASLAGLEIRRNGVLLGRGAWNVAVPVDGGSYAIKASAPGKMAWESSVWVKPESDRALTTVPPLSEEPKTAALPPVAGRVGTGPGPRLVPTADPPVQTHGWSGVQWGGATLLGAGVITLGVGGYYLASALKHNNASKTDCSADNFCHDEGMFYRDQAVRRGNVATVLGIVGGTLAAGGLTLIIVGRSGKKEQPSSVSASFGPVPGGFTGMVAGTF